MPKRLIFNSDGGKYIVLPYTGFTNFGAYTDPPTLRVAVPFFDNVSDALVPALKSSASYEEDLKLQGIAGITSLIAKGPSTSGTRTLAYEDKIAFPFLFFRGESREEHGILPTLYRTPAGQDPAIIVRRRLKAERRAARLMQAALLLGHGRRLSFEHGRAAARHYGVSSALTDFSFDPRIAACFAQAPFRDLEKQQPSSRPVAIIYCLSYDMLQRVFPTQGWKPLATGGMEIQFYPLGQALRIPFLAFDPQSESLVESTATIAIPDWAMNKTVTLRGVPVPGVRRIVLQQGIFIEIDVKDPADWITPMFFWYLLDFMSQKWAFFRADTAYSDPTGEISFAKILPPDSYAIRLASWVINSGIIK